MERGAHVEKLRHNSLNLQFQKFHINIDAKMHISIDAKEMTYDRSKQAGAYFQK